MKKILFLLFFSPLFCLGQFNLRLKVDSLKMNATLDSMLWYNDSGTRHAFIIPFPASGANTALSNLAAVSINTSLLAQTGVDLGSTANSFRDAYLFGSGTYGSTYLKLTGTPTSTRTVTFPNNTGTVAETNIDNSFSAAQTIAAGSSSPALNVTSTNSTGSTYFAQFSNTSGNSGLLCTTAGAGQFAARSSTHTDRELRFQVFSDGNLYFTMSSLTGAGTVSPSFNIGTGSDGASTNNGDFQIQMNDVVKARMLVGGNLFLGGSTSPTARLHIAAGTATASTAPLKFTAGTVLTTPESGVVETNSNNELLYSTSTTTASRGFVKVERYVAKTASYTATAHDFSIVFTSGTDTLTLPTAVGISGRSYELKNLSGNTAQIATTSSQTIDGIAAPFAVLTTKCYGIRSDGANWYLIYVY